MEHEKIANHSGQYEISFEEIPDRKLENQPELKDIDWGNYSEENLKVQKEKEREELEKIREDINNEETKKMEELYDDGGIPDGSIEHNRYDQFVKEPGSRPMTEEEKKAQSLKAGAIESWKRRKEEERKKKEEIMDEYWNK